MSYIILTRCETDYTHEVRSNLPTLKTK